MSQFTVGPRDGLLGHQEKMGKREKGDREADLRSTSASLSGFADVREGEDGGVEGDPSFWFWLRGL